MTLLAVKFRPLREGDIEALLADMRVADLQEIAASCDLPPEDALLESVRGSCVVYAVEFGDRLACIFGVAALSLAPPVGSPWLLGTRYMDDHPREMLRASKLFFNEHLLRSFKQMLNFVDARNARSIRWLRALGFTIHPAEPYGHRRLPFHRFTWGFDDVSDSRDRGVG